jgi:predicted small lipoprotein YifL
MDRHENRSLSGRLARYAWLCGACLAALLAVACGKKGPLYLPDDSATQNSSGDRIIQPTPSRPDR